MSTLEARGLQVNRGGRALLDGVSLRATSGEFLAVIGPNGAGKSTLLKCLAGILKPLSGTLTLDGTPLSQYAPKTLARRRAFLPQNPICEWPISVESLVGLGLMPEHSGFGEMPAGMRGRIAAVLAEFDLSGRKDQTATSLSGGELTRAMLARALVGNPDILIVDEPIAGLDPAHTLDAVQRLSNLAGKGKLVIAAVHDLTLAARFTTRAVVLDEGKLAADGPAATILDASLLKSVFHVEARIAKNEGRVFVDYLGPGH